MRWPVGFGNRDDGILVSNEARHDFPHEPPIDENHVFFNPSCLQGQGWHVIRLQLQQQGRIQREWKSCTVYQRHRELLAGVARDQEPNIILCGSRCRNALPHAVIVPQGSVGPAALHVIATCRPAHPADFAGPILRLRRDQVRHILNRKIRHSPMHNLLEKSSVAQTWTVRPSDGEPASPHIFKANLIPIPSQEPLSMR